MIKNFHRYTTNPFNNLCESTYWVEYIPCFFNNEIPQFCWCVIHFLQKIITPSMNWGGSSKDGSLYVEYRIEYTSIAFE